MAKRSSGVEQRTRSLRRSTEVGALALLLVAALSPACSGDDERPPAGTGAGSGRGGADRGGSTARGGSDQGGALQGGSDQGGAAEGGAAGAVGANCGDGMVGPAEDCDGDNFLGLACQTFGFDDGELSCDECVVDFADCTGTEHCGDGDDNDGDMLVDCADDDCSEACAEPCGSPEVLADPAEIMASTLGRGDAVSSTCSAASASPGPDSIYSFEAQTTGMLEIALDSDQYMQVSVLDGCSDSATTVACSGDYLSMPVSAGDTLLIAVEAYSPENAGPFTLRVMSRALDVCGDGYRDGSEDCDDGDLDPLDGCDDSCNLESTEEEPNGTTGTAGDYAAPHYGAIDPTDDVDVVSVTVASGPASIVASVSGFADDCITGAVDSLVEVLSSAGTPIGSDDDSGVGYCSRLVQTGVTAGTYYVRVSASPTGETPTFPYQLSIDVNRCGDGALGPGEQCDDGNQTPDDGCDGDCQSE